VFIVAGGSESRPTFSPAFDDEFPVGPQEGNNAFVGRNVLQGLVDGIDDLVHLRQPRWRRYRSIGPVLLGSAMWINDAELIDKIGQLSAACIVVTKQGRKPRDVKKLAQLEALNARTPGMPVRAFSSLTELAPKFEGKRVVVGPSSPMQDVTVPTIRTLGFRNIGRPMLPPILHAKLALLGHLWWHDEDEVGGVTDVVGFEARRLWVSSANFTTSSRRNLEFGYWTEEPAIVKGAERFLVKLMRSSEGPNPDADAFDPDLAEVDYDDEAMADAWAEMADDE
jgi:hypothetical protein